MYERDLMAANIVKCCYFSPTFFAVSSVRVGIYCDGRRGNEKKVGKNVT
jgi:hypothetical protein